MSCKIAFLCFSALPYTSNWGACQRVHYMANALSHEYDITVISSKYNDDSSISDKERFYKTEYFDNSFGRKMFSSRPQSYNRDSTPKSSRLKYKFKKMAFNIIAKSIKFANDKFYNEPTYFKGLEANVWIRSHKRAILGFLKDGQFKALIISIPPWNIISVDFVKKVRNMGLRVVIDYRDPWNCWNDKRGYPFYKEKQILNNVDLVFVTNENHKRRLIQDFALDETIVKVVMNGYDEDIWNVVESSYSGIKDTDKLVISYIGTIQFKDDDSFRNPTNFMKALELFSHKDEVIFRVVGCINDEAIKRYARTIPNFEMHGSVSQAESFLCMKRSDILVNFHTTKDCSSKYLIAGKAFDYYRSRAQLLSINGEEAYERTFIEKNACGYFSTNDTNEILAVLEKIYADWISFGKRFPIRDIQDNKYSRQYQNELAIGYISNLL